MDGDPPATHCVLQLHLGGSLLPTHRHHDRRLRAHHLEAVVQQETRRGSRTRTQDLRQHQETGKRRLMT